MGASLFVWLNGEDVHAFCKYIIGGMASFIMVAGVAAYKWIVSLIAKNDVLQDARLADLKEYLKPIEKKGGN